jgi:polysaccharide pyruvyl transferase WcaK-like protein
VGVLQKGGKQWVWGDKISSSQLKRIIHFCRRRDDNIGEIAIAHSIRDMLHSRLKISTYTPTEVTKLKTRQNSEFIRTLNHHDLCIVGGGGLYHKYFLPMNAQLIKSIEIPIVLYGIGYIRNLGDRGLNGGQVESIRLLNKRAKLTSVRDECTYKFLRNLGISHVHTIGDPAIFLGSKETSQINLDESRIKIGVNVACHYWTLYHQYLNKTIAEYAKTCKFLIKNLNAEIIYLKHHPGEEYVIKLLKKKLSIKVADPIFDPYKMKYIYGKLDLVISMMMHSTILAFGSGVPIINVAYDIKNYNFMEFINQKDKVIDVRELDSTKINGLIMHTLDDSKNIKGNFKTLKRKLWRKQENFLTEIKELSTEPAF